MNEKSSFKLNNKRNRNKAKYTKKRNRRGKPEDVTRDTLFQSCMEATLSPKEFIAEYLLEELREGFDLSEMHLENQTFVDSELRHRFYDILYSAPFKLPHKQKCEKAYIYFIAMRQSKFDEWVAIKLEGFIENLIRKNTSSIGKQQPIVVPIILIQNKNKRERPRNLSILFQRPHIMKAFGISCPIILDKHNSSALVN